MTGPALDFTYQSQPMRVVFRPGAVPHAVAAETGRLGLRRVLVVCGERGQDTARAVAAALGDECAGVHAGARMHVPAPTAERAVEAAREAGADGCAAVGGGSAIGLAKAVARRTGLPVVAVPTTYAGSEMTPVWGETEDGVKRTGRDPRVLPRSVVYDPLLTLTMPAAQSAASGMNAMAHAVEALYAPDASPVVALMARDGVRALARALPDVVADPTGPAARGSALYGAWLCGACLGATSMGLHHRLCHVLGGAFGLPHAETHAVVLPHVLAFNAPSAPSATAALRRALEVADPARELYELGGRLGVPRSLAALGLSFADLDRAVDATLRAPYANPRSASARELRAVLQAAFDGAPPPGGRLS
ncbi:maleylacetate reductase [Streptomyces sp. NBC_00199]|uniref:maleylacetate reductase n=1 Tax=Streptomyces sp. NBC_00199 TaxID=2975678 RepID=UPI00224C9C9E|nr:maleylacetate reductase [Streptomyces sp. NBC_00199]MCX5268258.1 maleylacetate reductase [Streptomyces sp. NBC_00199]